MLCKINLRLIIFLNFLSALLAMTFNGLRLQPQSKGTDIKTAKIKSEKSNKNFPDIATDSLQSNTFVFYLNPLKI